MLLSARPLVGAVTLTGLITATLVAQDARPLRLDPVVTYGWSDLADSTRPLSATDRRLFAGELGAASGAVEGRNGEVFILDGINKKVAVFDKDGLYLRVFGGVGEGPGEFRRPTRIAIGADGAIHVWDPQLRRITRFHPDGKLLSQLTLPTVPTVGDFTVTGNRAWFVRLLLGPGAAVRSFDLTTGAAVDSFATLTDQEVTISGFGAPGSITSNAAGEVTYAGPFPVTLRTWSGGKVTSAGANRFPAARGYLSDGQTRRTPVSMRGIVARHDGSYAAIYSTSEVTTADVRVPQRFWLEILAPDGTSRGRTELVNMEVMGGIAATANGDLLLNVVGEYPQVRRVRVAFGTRPTK